MAGKVGLQTGLRVPAGDRLLGCVNFLENDQGSKRLLSSLWKTLEEEGHDVEEIQEKIKETVKKCIITLEPYLTHYYRTNISKDPENIENTKVF